MLNFIILFILLIQSIHLSNLNKPLNLDKRKLEEKSNDIVILHLNDVHCGVNDTIGYDGYKLYANELKEKYNYVITVDVGDHVQGGTLGAISDGSVIIEILNEIEFDVVVLGNHEFDYHLERLSQLNNNLTNKYICANFCYHKDKSPVFEPYKIIEKGDKKIAFIGVLTPLTFSKTYLSSIKDSNGEQKYDFLSKNGGQELYDKLQEYINDLRKNKNVNYVILLTHIGMTLEQYKSEELLSKLEGVDAILDGHTHKIYNVTSGDKNGKSVYIAQTGTKLQSIGKITLKTDGTITAENIKEVPEPTNKNNAIQIKRGNINRWVDKEFNGFINNLWKRYEEQLNKIFGHSNYDLIIIPRDSNSSSSVYCRYQECTLGNLVSDAIKDVGNAEISILNGGSCRYNLYKGDITTNTILNVLPWFNDIVQKQISGQAVLDALEFGVSKLPSVSGGFPQVSGITFDLNPDINSTVITDENGVFVKVAGKRRVSNVKINGRELDLNRKYNTSLNIFMANGGDGFSMFNQFDVYNESGATDTQSLSLYIQYFLNGEIPERYKDLQGRININNGYDDDIIKYKYYTHKNRGLSTGSIIAIIIPLLAVLIIAIVITIILKLKTPAPTPVPAPSPSQTNPNPVSMKSDEAIIN